MNRRTDDGPAPGDERGRAHEIARHAQLPHRAGARAALTVGSFWVASGTSLIYTPGVPMALAALAVAQMGVHLAFFLHITTGPDNTNNASRSPSAPHRRARDRGLAVDHVPPRTAT